MGCYVNTRFWMKIVGEDERMKGNITLVGEDLFYQGS